MFESKEGRSEYNAGFAFLNHINAEFVLASQSIHEGDLNTWIDCFINIMLLLRNYIKDNEWSEKKKELQKLKDIIAREALKRNMKKGRINPSDYWEFFEFHAWLRMIYGRSGLENKMVEDAAKALR